MTPKNPLVDDVKKGDICNITFIFAPDGSTTVQPFTVKAEYTGMTRVFGKMTTYCFLKVTPERDGSRKPYEFTAAQIASMAGKDVPLNKLTPDLFK